MPMDSIFAFQSLPRRLVNTAFDPDATPHDLLVLVSSLAVFWWAIFCALHKVLHPFAQRQQWLKQAMGREYDRVGLSMCKALNVGWTRERYIEITLNDWPKMQGIYLQHFVGGALCVPAVLGFDDSWATSLACLGVLSEMGWELADVTDIFVTRSMAADGKERVPNTMVFILMVHHSMTLTMGLPMVLKYRELKEMHQMTFNLQWAAAIAISMNEYTKCLDLSKPRQMMTFRLMNGIGFVIMVWMRGIQWFVLSGRLLTIWYNDDEWAFVALGSIICVLISAFNIILCIYPYGKKMLKYGPASKKLTRVDTAETVAAIPDSDDER